MDKYAASLKGFFEGITNMANNTKVQQVIGTSIALVVTKVLADQLTMIIKDKYNDYKSAEYFEDMLKEHPQLKQYKAEDIAKYWNSLNHFSPTMAKDPLASGAYLTQTLRKLSSEEFGGPPPDTYATLVDIEKKITDAKQNKGSQNKIFDTLGSTVLNMASN